MKACPQCNEPLADEALFCPIDGTPLARTDADPLVGTVVDNGFLVLSELGRGGSGVVYRAEQLQTQRPVALKVLNEEICREEGALSRFRQVLAALREVHNPHHTEILQTGRTADGRLYAAMELLQGQTWADRLAHDKRMPLAKVIEMMTQVATALAPVHARGWAHGDLRTANLFICPDERNGTERIKVLDLGLAHLVHESRHEAAGVALGDARYVPPELRRNGVPDPRSDVYALAALLFDSVTGRPPFEGGLQAVLDAHETQVPPRLSAFAPEVPPHVDEAVARALQKDRNKRFASADEFVSGLLAPEAPAAQAWAATADTLVSMPPAPAVSGTVMTQPAESPARARASAGFGRVPRPVVEDLDGSGQSGMWFMEGQAASRAAEDHTPGKTGELPALYQRLQEEIEHVPTANPHRKIIAIASVGAVFLVGLVVVLAVGKGEDGEIRSKAVPATNPLAPVRAVEPAPVVPAPAPPSAPEPVFQPPPGAPPPAAAAPAPSAASSGPARAPAPAPAPAPPAPPTPPPKTSAPKTKAITTSTQSSKTSSRLANSKPASREDADDYARAGKEHLRRGSYSKAAEAYEKAHKLDPKNAEAIAGLGEVAFEQGHYAQAVNRLREAVKLRPRSVRYMVLLGNAYFKLGQTRSALEMYRRALDLDPGSQEAKSGLHAAEKRLGGG